MSAALILPDLSTPEAFAAWVELQPTKYEMVAGRLVMMAGGSNAHSLIAVNAVAALRTRLRGGRCRTYNSDFLVEISTKDKYYPDATVACDETRDYTDRPVLDAVTARDRARLGGPVSVSHGDDDSGARAGRPRASRRDGRGILRRDRRVAGDEPRVRAGRDRPDRARGQGGQRA